MASAEACASSLAASIEAVHSCARAVSAAELEVLRTTRSSALADAGEEGEAEAAVVVAAAGGGMRMLHVSLAIAMRRRGESGVDGMVCMYVCVCV